MRFSKNRSIMILFIGVLFLFSSLAAVADNKKHRNSLPDTETTGILGGNTPLTFKNEDVNDDVLQEALKLKQKFNIKLDEDR